MVKELVAPGIENHETFLERLSGFPPADQKDIDHAYDSVKKYHENQKRVNPKIRYFEHLRATVLILLDECEIQDPNIVKAALLHDTAEDTNYFGNPALMFYPAWSLFAQTAIAAEFGEKTASIVLSVTEPRVNNIDIFTKKQAKTIYYEQLRNASPEALLVKMADRLHNLRTQYETPLAKQKEKVLETKEVYLPIFRQARVRYPEAADYLIGEINKAILALEASFVAHDNGDGSLPRADVII